MAKLLPLPAPQEAQAWQHQNLQHLDSPRWARALGLILLLCVLGGVAILVWMPWQQNVWGSGEVIAFSPLERRQELEAPINGRIKSWSVTEGSLVKKGDLIAILSDNDPDYLRRLQDQRQNLLNQQSFQQAKVLAYTLGVQNYTGAVSSTLAAAKAKVESARAKLAAAQQDREADQAQLRANQQNQEREQALYAQGLSSQRNRELAEAAYQKSVADVAKDEAKIKEAYSEIRVAQAEQNKAEASAQAALNSSQANLEEARASLEKSRAEIIKLDTQLARQATQEIRAPLTGRILKLNTVADTVYVKAGDKLATLVPETQERAVSLYMKGNDIPLIRPGRKVRLQFEGWPALQFSGWPSVAVGTFGGEVVLVDATADLEKDLFRIVVRPGPKDQWPDNIYLRQGVKSRGWVLLETVPLGYELWRQFNGFPPRLEQAPAKSESADVVKRKAKK